MRALRFVGCIMFAQPHLLYDCSNNRNACDNRRMTSGDFVGLEKVIASVVRECGQINVFVCFFFVVFKTINDNIEVGIAAAQYSSRTTSVLTHTQEDTYMKNIEKKYKHKPNYNLDKYNINFYKDLIQI